MTLTEDNKKRIKENSFLNPKEEACGFIVSSGPHQFVIAVKNESQTPNKSFIISPLDYLKVNSLGKIEAYYHSHPLEAENKSFSEYDKKISLGHNINAVLFCLDDESFHFFDPQREKNNSFIGRDFVFGKQDCFSLCRDYYKKTLGIEIKDYERDSNWSKKNNQLISQSFESQGFKKIKSNEKMQKNDCIVLYDSRKVFPSHLAIYLGGEEILHHPRNRKSTIEIYSERLKKFEAYVLRYGN